MSTVTPVDAPRPRSDTWQEGDAFTLGRTRWIIRVIRGAHVELEAANAPAGIWWTTTLDKIPTKETGAVAEAKTCRQEPSS